MYTYNGNIITYGDKWLNGYDDPYNPLKLPYHVIRCQYTEGVEPVPDMLTNWTSKTQVSESPNVWDIYVERNDWTDVLTSQYELLAVLGANTFEVTNMFRLFWDCRKLQSVALFDTSQVTDIDSMFFHCPKLTSVPFFDFSNVTDAEALFRQCYDLTSIPNYNFSRCNSITQIMSECESMTYIPDFQLTTALTSVQQSFDYCPYIETGILSTYNKLVGLGTITNHNGTFEGCGTSTQSGTAELAQIPSDWKTYIPPWET